VVGVCDGSAVAFQLTKAYGAPAYARPIFKPVAPSVRVALDGAELPATDFSVDSTTGVVTLMAPPAAGTSVSAGFLFDTPVRFDTDRLDLSLDGFGAGRALSVPLVEILV
jgi:uncharacterized protein (TIGR02217 family)